jgi:hypothetical protein
VEELEAVCPGGQKGTAIPADGVFFSNLGLVGAVAILSPKPKYRIQAVQILHQVK